MDKRISIGAFIVLLCLIYLGRNRLLDMVTRAGGFELLPGDTETVTLPAIKLPSLPTYKKDPSMWVQTTGLMCHCDSNEYVGPILINEYEVPQPPTPRYVYQQQAVSEIQAQESPYLTYTTFGLDSTYAIWGGRPYEQVWRGSDGRVFLKPKPDAMGRLTQPNISTSQAFIGTNEYRLEGETIVYGPYRYNRNPFMSGYRR